MNRRKSPRRGPRDLTTALGFPDCATNECIQAGSRLSQRWEGRPTTRSSLARRSSTQRFLSINFPILISDVACYWQASSALALTGVPWLLPGLVGSPGSQNRESRFSPSQSPFSLPFISRPLSLLRYPFASEPASPGCQLVFLSSFFLGWCSSSSSSSPSLLIFFPILRVDGRTDRFLKSAWQRFPLSFHPARQAAFSSASFGR